MLPDFYPTLPFTVPVVVYYNFPESLLWLKVETETSVLPNVSFDIGFITNTIREDLSKSFI